MARVVKIFISQTGKSWALPFGKLSTNIQRCVCAKFGAWGVRGGGDGWGACPGRPPGRAVWEVDTCHRWTARAALALKFWRWGRLGCRKPFQQLRCGGCDVAAFSLAVIFG